VFGYWVKSRHFPLYNFHSTSVGSIRRFAKNRKKASPILLSITMFFADILGISIQLRRNASTFI
jgi:hypothetical protein